MSRSLTDERIERYSRQIILPEVGGTGQTRLLDSSVLIVGAGALGCPVAAYLAAGGVGTIGIADYDTVELSNLQRQILHTTSRIGRAKVDSVAAFIHRLNPDVVVRSHHGLVGPDTAVELFKAYDVIVDAGDGFPTKYLLNDAAVLTGRPLIHGSILAFEGMLTTILPRQGPCYRCAFPNPPPPGEIPTCREAGVLGSVAGIIGTLQATEVLKLLLGVGEPAVGRIITVDALDATFRELHIAASPDCPICGLTPALTDLSHFTQSDFFAPACNPSFCAQGVDTRQEM